MTEKTRGVGGRFEREDGGVAEGEQATDGQAGVRAPRPKYCRVFVRKRVAESMPAIVHALIEQAKQGSVPHLTLLLKTAGLDTKGELVPTTKRKSKGLATILKEKWAADEVKLAEAERQRQAKMRPVEETIRSVEETVRPVEETIRPVEDEKVLPSDELPGE